MITATCRVCHQDWTLERLPPAILLGLGAIVSLTAPCGHGMFVGHSLWELVQNMDPQSHHAKGSTEEEYLWQWLDADYDEAVAAYNTYVKKHPRPTWEEWNPPALTLTCVCGASLQVKGVQDTAEEGEIWRGECPTCGLIAVVESAGNTVTYAADRARRYLQADQKWQRRVPQVVQPRAVESLRESAESGAE